MSDKKPEKGLDEIFCSSCGVFIKKEAEICPHCGVRQLGQHNTSLNNKQGFAIASLVLGIVSFFIPFIGSVGGIVGLIFGIIGLQNSKKGMAIAGIILSSLGILIGIISIVGLISGIFGIFSDIFNVFKYF